MKNANGFKKIPSGYEVWVDGEKYVCQRKVALGNSFWSILKNGVEVAVALGAKDFNSDDPKNKTAQSIINAIKNI